MNPALVRFVLRSVTAGFFLLAAAMLYLQYRVPMQWPSAVGRVEHVAVVPADEETGRLPGQRFVPEVIYTYEAGGRLYEARTVARFRWVYRTPERAALRLEESGIFVGARVPVFYNPEEPEEAVLIRGFPWSRWDVRLAFLVLVFLPVVVVTYSLRDLRHGNPRPGEETDRGRFW